MKTPFRELNVWHLASGMPRQGGVIINQIDLFNQEKYTSGCAEYASLSIKPSGTSFNATAIAAIVKRRRRLARQLVRQHANIGVESDRHA
jgi:hypothetical protein